MAKSDAKVELLPRPGPAISPSIDPSCYVRKTVGRKGREPHPQAVVPSCDYTHTQNFYRLKIVNMVTQPPDLL